MKRFLHDAAFIPVCIGIFISCGTGPDTGNPGSFGPRPAITGKLLESDGASPASGALVTLQPRDAVAPIDGAAKIKVQGLMARTGSDGAFAIASCPAGVYSIEGTDADGNAVRIDSVVVTDPQVTTDLPARSLQSTGTVSGTIVLDNGGDPANVFILAFGSDRFVQATGDGTFYMDDLPYGNYTLKIVCVLPDCGVNHTVAVTVNPGDTSVLDTITLATRETGAPANFSLVYDSMKLSVSLRWDPSGATGVGGYNVYRYDRKEADQYPLQPLNAEPVGAVCTYRDTALFTGHSYVYGVAAVNLDNSIGRKAGPLEVTTTFGGYRADTISCETPGNLPAGVFWDAEDRLIIMPETAPAGAPLTLEYYNDNLEFDHTILIPPSGDYPRQHATLRNNRIYFTTIVRPEPDSAGSRPYVEILHCYSLDGVSHYSVNFQKRINSFDVRNDTLFIQTDSRNDTMFIQVDSMYYSIDHLIQTAAYDSTGRQLFIIDNGNSGLTTMHHATNGRIYSMTDTYNGNPDLIIKEHFYPSMSSNVIFQMCTGGSGNLFYEEIDVNGGQYLLCGYRGFIVVLESGELYSRICQKDNSPLSSAAIDTKGRIALCYWGPAPSGKVVVLTPP